MVNSVTKLRDFLELSSQDLIMRLPPKRTPQIYLVQRKYCTDQREIYAYHGLFSFVRARGGMYPAYPIFQKFLTKIGSIRLLPVLLLS